MSENDMTPNLKDAVGRELQNLVRIVRDEVTLPDWTKLTHGHLSFYPKRRFTIFSVAAALVILGLSLSIALGDQLGDGPPATRVETHASFIGGITLVSDNLLQVLSQSPPLAVHSKSIHFPVLDANHSAIAFGAGDIWIVQSATPLGGSAKPLGGPAPSWACGELVRLATTMTVKGALPLRFCPAAVTFGAGSVWVLGYQIGRDGYRLYQVAPETMTVRSTTVIDGGPNGVTPVGDTGAKQLFAVATSRVVAVAVQSTTGTSQIVTLNVNTRTTIASVTIPADRGMASALSANNAAFWVGTTGGYLYRIEPATGAITRTQMIGIGVTSLSATSKALWITVTVDQGRPANAYPGLDTIELNPTNAALVRDTSLPLILVSANGSDVEGILGSARGGEYIAKIDRKRGAIEGVASSPFKAPAYTPDTILAAAGSAWIINTNLQTLTKVTFMR